MDDEVGLLHRARPADVGRRQVHADDQLPETLNRLRARHRVEHVAGDHLRLRVRLHVDDWRGAGNGDRFLERADLHVGVDRHREVRRQLEPLALERREALQREGDDIRARPQIDHLVFALGVGEHRPRFFNEDVAGHFNLHAGQHRARRVFHGAADGALRVRRRRQEANADQCPQCRKFESPSRHCARAPSASL